MTLEEKRKILLLLNTYNFYGPYDEDPQKDTDRALLTYINTFLRNYGNIFKTGKPIIIEYNKSIFDLLAFQLLKNLAPLTKVKPTFYIYNIQNITEDDKNIFKSVPFIGKKKLKKIKKGFYVKSYHPICNVLSTDIYFNHFITLEPLKHFTPTQLDQMIDYYIDKKCFLYKKIEQDELYNFFKYPIDKLPNKFVGIQPQNIYLFKLSGTEKDFRCYDFLIEESLKNEEINSIFLYQVDSEEAAKWTKENLSPYIYYYHSPNEYSMIIGENNLFHPTKTFSYTDFLEEK